MAMEEGHIEGSTKHAGTVVSMVMLSMDGVVTGGNNRLILTVAVQGGQWGLWNCGLAFNS